MAKAATAALTRMIAITHRVKQTTKGEARPTTALVRAVGSKDVTYKFDGEQEELDFVLGIFTTSRKSVTREEAEGYRFPWQAKITERSASVPATYDGFHDGDIVLMIAGGSGDDLAYAFSNRAKRNFKDAAIYLVPPIHLRKKRDQSEKGKTDNELLIELFAESPELFRKCSAYEEDIIRLRSASRARHEAMKARIECGNRLRSYAIGNLFHKDFGEYPEGAVEEEYQRLVANDGVYTSLVLEEKQRQAELARLCKGSRLYRYLFEDVVGVAHLIGAPLIAEIGDITRFESVSQLISYSGLHVLDEEGKKLERGAIPAAHGVFVRARAGSDANNYKRRIRQLVYNALDSFMKQKGSYWWMYLQVAKAKARQRNPEMVVDGKVRNNKAHIHNRGKWRTATRFLKMVDRRWRAYLRGEEPRPLDMEKMTAEYQLWCGVEEQQAA